jgi:hypothetical protein
MDSLKEARGFHLRILMPEVLEFQNVTEKNGGSLLFDYFQKNEK